MPISWLKRGSNLCMVLALMSATTTFVLWHCTQAQAPAFLDTISGMTLVHTARNAYAVKHFTWDPSLATVAHAVDALPPDER